MYVWAHFNSEWEKLNVHLFLALFLTVPMLVYLVVELGRWGIGMVATRARVAVPTGGRVRGLRGGRE